ncbi:MAG: hypothetical protein ABEL04_08335 [Salinibacter sp.]|uniref:hypothetical protein n=1 Tax=Salinibacter sp. TaxID=2065818 RepID=UPI0035D421A1
MSVVPVIATVMVLGIPILGILLAGYKEWLKFKAKHQELGTSTREIEDRLQSLRERLDHVERERDALQQRVRNLETIVTSEAWIAQHDDTTDGPPLDAVEEDALKPPSDPASETRNESERTAQIARRLRDR